MKPILGQLSASPPPVDAVSFDLPLNLAGWVDADTIMCWVQAEVDLLEQSDPSAFKPTGEFDPDGFPRALASVLVFAYLTGVFDAEEIRANCVVQPASRILSSGFTFLLGDFRRFRRANLQLLKRLLTSTLARAIAERFQLSRIPFPREGVQRLEEQATQRLNIARHMESDAE